jgi:hypothetical protein
MPNFTWILQIPELDWTPYVRAKRWVRMARPEFAERCGLPNDERLMDAFRSWASTQRQSYSLAWDTPLNRKGDVLIVVRDTDHLQS